jgi:hypothetical protein
MAPIDSEFIQGPGHVKFVPSLIAGAISKTNGSRHHSDEQTSNELV